MPKYGVFSGPSFPVFSPKAGKYGPEKTPYLDTFHAVFKALKVPLKNIFSTEMFVFYKVYVNSHLWAITVSKCGCGIDWILFIWVASIAGVAEKLF